MSLQITSNLNDALRKLRHRHESRTLWVDAICINQADGQEKAGQIPLMAQIFRGASRVVAWLGPYEHGSPAERGMRFLNDTSFKWRGAAATPSGEHSSCDNRIDHESDQQLGFHNEGRYILDLLHLPWFSRLWCIQEVAVNPDVILLCGSTQISWIRFTTAFSILRSLTADLATTLPMEPLQMVANLWFDHGMNKAEFLDRFGGLGDQNLFNLVQVFHKYECTDPRDRIFALYNLTSSAVTSSQPPEGAKIVLDIDYGKCVRQTYQDFAIASLRSTLIDIRTMLTATLLRKHQPDSDEWPSWIPDWQVKPRGHVNLPEIHGYHDRSHPDRIMVGLSTVGVVLPGDTPLRVEANASKFQETLTGLPESNLLTMLPSIVDVLQKHVTSERAFEILLHLLNGRHPILRYDQDSLFVQTLEEYFSFLWSTYGCENDEAIKAYCSKLSVFDPIIENRHFFRATRTAFDYQEVSFGFANCVPNIGDEIIPHKGGNYNSRQVILSSLILRSRSPNEKEIDIRSFRLIGAATVTGSLPDLDYRIARSSAFFLV